LNRYQQKSTIPAANPSLGIRCGHQCSGFFLSKELDRSSFEAFHGNRENALALHAQRGFIEGDVSEEGMESREPMVSRSWPVASIVFQVFEECFQKLRIEFLDVQNGWSPTETAFGELQQETEGVAVARHST
jgi:hypothetical protein